MYIDLLLLGWTTIIPFYLEAQTNSSRFSCGTRIPDARVLTRTSKSSYFFCISLPASAPLKLRIEYKKISLLTYKALNGEALSHPKEFIVPYYANGALQSKNAGLLVVERARVKPEEGLSATKRLSCGINSQYGFGRQTLFSTFKSNLDTLLFNEAYS